MQRGAAMQSISMRPHQQTLPPVLASPLASDADSENEAIMGGEARELSQSLAFSQLSESDDDQE